MGKEEERYHAPGQQVGVELSGALKNVMALAAGITVGLGYGHNTMAALTPPTVNITAVVGFC